MLRRQPKNSPEPDPIQRILMAIVGYGIHDGARQIRLQAGRALKVFYLINGEWQEQMRIPPHVNADLIERLRSLCQSREDVGRPILFFPIHLRDDSLGLEIDFEVHVVVSPGEAGEDALLELRREPRFPDVRAG